MAKSIATNPPVVLDPIGKFLVLVSTAVQIFFVTPQQGVIADLNLERVRTHTVVNTLKSSEMIAMLSGIQGEINGFDFGENESSDILDYGYAARMIAAYNEGLMEAAEKAYADRKKKSENTLYYSNVISIGTFFLGSLMVLYSEIRSRRGV